MFSFFDRYFNLETRSFNKHVLSCMDVANCRASTTKDELDYIINDFGLENKIKYLVTDNCRTMLSAFDKSSGESNTISEFLKSDSDTEIEEDEPEDDANSKAYLKSQRFNWSGCSAHQICTVLRNSFKEIHKSKTLINVQNLHKSIKRLITHFNHTGKNKHLDSSLKQDLEIRFDSIYDSYNSVMVNFNKLKELTKEDNDVKVYLEPILKHFDLFEQMLNLLSAFYEARQRLSDDTKSTINLVLPYYYSLLSACEVDQNDDTRIKEVKIILSQNLKKSYRLKEIHYKSTYLTPKYKGMKCIPIGKRAAIINLCKEKLRLDLEDLVSEVNLQTNQSDEPNETSNEKESKSILCDFEDDEDDEYEELIDDCVSFYSNYKFRKEDRLIDPCIFFSNLKEINSKLATYAISILTTPATSTIIEQQFSIAGLIMNKQRNCLLPRNLHNSIFIKSNNFLVEF